MNNRAAVYRNIIGLLIDHLPEKPKSLNSATAIKNLTPLGEAIRSSDPANWSRGSSSSGAIRVRRQEKMNCRHCMRQSTDTAY